MIKDNPAIELLRIKTGPFASNATHGNNGWFKVTGPQGKLFIIASDGRGWEHVSVSPVKKNRIPTWDEMCFVKDIFWGEDECVVQYHPRKAQYVNNNPYVLHLWKPIGLILPEPPASLVGVLARSQK